MAMLEIKDLAVSFDDFKILWDISLSVEEGQIVAVVGSNGAGKSTLLNTISGLIPPSSGSVAFLGKRIDALSPADIVRMKLSQVPEGGHLFPEMKIKENLELGAYTCRSKRERKEALEMVYNIFPILKARERKLAGTLSGGERQMLAIGRSLMATPVLLLLDEPSLGLAPKMVLHLFEIVKRINKEGITILLVEQNVRRALAQADKGYVLETGRIVMKGEGKKLLESEQVKKAYLGM